MNIGILFFTDKDHGLGHYYRSTTLAETLEKNGHNVYYFSNLQHRRKTFFQLRPGNKYDLYHILHQCKLDWLIIDTPDLPEDYVFEFKFQFGFKIMYLHAKEDNDDIELNIIQGLLPGKHSGVEYIILRPMLDNCWTSHKSPFWFVFGGGADKIGLVKMFTKTMDDGAFLVNTSLSDEPEKVNDKHMIITPNNDEAFLGLMSSSKKACIAFGTVAWELVYYGIPTYAFSIDQDHLEWAQAMENNGLIKAYPEVGIPEESKVKEFLNEPFQVVENNLDLEGAVRVMRLMEDYCE